ncbi:hypothetical protein [Bacillus sp. NPDC094106]|uniref:hypothetical protein n=1 Tax=Bacillus sp. NPDC094106 TaxID=3363949 RepID=UPI003821BE0B
MIKSGMFNSVNGDRRYDARDFASYFSMFIGNGVFPNPANGFKVVSNSDMTVTLKAGQAWIHGYYVTNTDDYQMAIDVADGVLNRIDRVVLQLNYLNREIVPVVKKGQFASSPIAPVLKRDGDAYEIALADIYIGKGALSITQANITDLRLNKDLCGIVHGVVDQVDTTAIFNQYQDWFERTKQKGDAELTAWKNEQQQEFLNWFTNLQDLLSENAETNILQKIYVLAKNMGDKNTLLTTEKDSLVKAINELFISANDLKANWASVIGSPLSASDKSAQLKSKTQNIKNSFAQKLVAKDVSASGNDPLQTLVNKIDEITDVMVKGDGGRIKALYSKHHYVESGNKVIKYNNKGVLLKAFDSNIPYQMNDNGAVRFLSYEELIKEPPYSKTYYDYYEYDKNGTLVSLKKKVTGYGLDESTDRNCYLLLDDGYIYHYASASWTGNGWPRMVRYTKNGVLNKVFSNIQYIRVINDISKTLSCGAGDYDMLLNYDFTPVSSTAITEIRKRADFYKTLYFTP